MSVSVMLGRIIYSLGFAWISKAKCFGGFLKCILEYFGGMYFGVL